MKVDITPVVQPKQSKRVSNVMRTGRGLDRCGNRTKGWLRGFCKNGEYMVIVDGVMKEIMGVLRRYPALGIDDADPDVLKMADDDLREAVMKELNRQYASLYPIYSTDMSIAFHNLKATLRYLGNGSSFILELLPNIRTVMWKAVIKTNGTDFVGDDMVEIAAVDTQPAMAMDKVCREALAWYARVK